MAAGTWIFWREAKSRIGEGQINFTSDNVKIGLFKASFTTSFDTVQLSVTTYGSLGRELPAATGYTAGGKDVGSAGLVLSGDNVVFSGAEVIWTGTGGTLGGTDLQFAVLHVSLAGGTDFPLAYVTLSTAAFGVGSGSTLTINSGGADIFTIT